MMTASKHVKVVVRARPTANFANNVLEVLPQQNIINVHIPRQDDMVPLSAPQQIDWAFKFDGILQNSKQSDVYEEYASPIVQSFLNGYNGTILAYGQTGAGKTFTMTGLSENYNQRGIIPRALHHLFGEIQDRPQNAFTVRLSYLEIYNEAIYDLLSPGGDTMEVSVVEEKNGCFVKGLTQVIVTSEEEALSYMFEGETNRSLGYHTLNHSSSRSHTVFTVYLESKSRLDSSADVLFSKLNLVDLAGSERVAKTHSTGKTLKEATFINKSLTFLEQVIIALADKKRDHIPYRQSRLTNVLRDSLGGNCNTLMIANIWGESSHIEETVSTLRFASRMMCVTNEPIINVQYDPLTVIKKQEREIRELKQELAMHDTLFGRSRVQYEPFNETQRLELTKRVKNWLDGTEEELEIVTLRQVKEIFSVFKQLYSKSMEPPMRITDSVAFNRTIPRSSNAGSTEKEINELNEEEEEGVGEPEGTGFAIGLSSNPSSAKKRAPKKNKIQKKETTPSTGNLTNGPSPAGSIINLPQRNISSSSDASGDKKEVAPPSPMEPSTPRLLETPIESNPSSFKNASMPILPPISKKTKPKKNEEFEVFKKGSGKELAVALSDAKEVYAAKKKQLIDLVNQLTTLKTTLHELHTQITQEIDQAVLQEAHHDPNLHPPMISESCQLKRIELKKLKIEYKHRMDQVKSLHLEMEYAKQVVERCRERLVKEYDAWFHSIYESNAHGSGNGDHALPGHGGHVEWGGIGGGGLGVGVGMTMELNEGSTSDLMMEVTSGTLLPLQFSELQGTKSVTNGTSKGEDSAYQAYIAALNRTQKKRSGPIKSMI